MRLDVTDVWFLKDINIKKQTLVVSTHVCWILCCTTNPHFIKYWHV